MTHYLIHTRVVSITERFIKTYSHGVGAEAIFVDTSLGWYAVFEGSREAIFLGKEKPGFEAGDEVEIIIRKKERPTP